MLSLYEKDYKGIIPQNTYLILGDQPSGSVDSSVFGLVDKSDILGKAEKLP
jgi:type IV secretory pathway protease TraF